MHRVCILYAEDDENDQLFLQDAFEQAGISNPLRMVADGQEAIDYLTGTGPYADRQAYPLPGMIWLDLKMPRKSGLQVLEWIRSQAAFKTLIVIVFTSSHQPKDIERAYELGANSFVVKPVGTRQRIEMAQRFKGWWLDYNQLGKRRTG
jgi:CheY-like chemotaxis protein